MLVSDEMEVVMPLKNPDELNLVALEVLSDQEQVDLSELVDEGHVKSAQKILYNSLVALLEEGRLNTVDFYQYLERIGMAEANQ
jgi:hypothetical protein